MKQKPKQPVTKRPVNTKLPAKKPAPPPQKWPDMGGARG